MLNPNDNPPQPAPVAARVFAIVFGITFGGIGLAVLGFLWTAQGFFEPPTFFKIFGSLIALPFVAFGVMALLGGFGMKGVALKSPAESLAEQLKELRQELPQQPTSGAAPATNYTCPHCGAPLASSSDASPHGDVKCRHCETWFNIYGK